MTEIKTQLRGSEEARSHWDNGGDGVVEAGNGGVFGSAVSAATFKAHICAALAVSFAAAISEDL
jgi:hypothetical protein